MPEQDLATQWASFDGPRRQRLLARMSPEQKTNLRKILEGQGHTAGTTAAADPAAASATPVTPRSLTQRASDFINRSLPNLSPADIHSPDQRLQDVSETLRPFANVVTRAIKSTAGAVAGLANSHPLQAAEQAVQDNLHPLAALRRNAAEMQAQTQAANHPYDPTTRTGVIEPGQALPKPTEEDVTDYLGDAAAQVALAEAGGKALGAGVGAARVLADPASAARLAAGKLPLPSGSGALRRFGQRITNTSPKAVEREIGKLATKAAEDRERVRVSNQDATEKTLRARGTVDDKNAEGMQANADKRLQIIKANTDAVRAHADEAQGVREHNARVVERKRQLQETQGKVSAASRQLDQKIQAAKANATAENNANWQAVREKTGEEEGDITGVKMAVQAAQRVADPQSSPIFKSIMREGADAPGPDPAMRRSYDSLTQDLPNRPSFDEWHQQYMGGMPAPFEGDTASFDRLHRWYSYVSDQMYGGGRLDGHLYKQLGNVRDALNTAMQGVAERTGAAQDLKNARESHTNLMETFSDSPNVQQTNASKALQETNPEYVKQQQAQARMAMLSRYDPEIESLSNHVQNLREGADALSKGPSELKPLPAPPQPKELPDFTPEPYGEPKPQDAFKRPEMNLQQVRTNMLAAVTKRWSDISQYKLRRFGVSAISGAATFFATHSPGESTLAFSSLYAASELAPNIAAAIVNKPAVLEWLTKPTLEDIDTLRKIPHGDLIKITDGLTGIAAEAARRGRPVRLAPEVQKLLGARNVAMLKGAQKALPKNAAEARAQAPTVDNSDPTVDAETTPTTDAPAGDDPTVDEPKE